MDLEAQAGRSTVSRSAQDLLPGPVAIGNATVLWPTAQRRFWRRFRTVARDKALAGRMQLLHLGGLAGRHLREHWIEADLGLDPSGGGLVVAGQRGAGCGGRRARLMA